MGSNICVGCFGRPVQFVPKILEVWREKIKRKHGKECSFVIRNGDSKGNQTQIPSWQLYIGSSIVQWAGTQESNFCVFADCVAPGFYGNTWPTQLGWIFNKHEFMLWSRILWVHDHAKTVQSWKWFTPVLFFSGSVCLDFALLNYSEIPRAYLAGAFLFTLSQQRWWSFDVLDYLRCLLMICIWVILRCWGNSSMVCQQNSDAL